jgi:hypothetical protein
MELQKEMLSQYMHLRMAYEDLLKVWYSFKFSYNVQQLPLQMLILYMPLLIQHLRQLNLQYDLNVVQKKRKRRWVPWNIHIAMRAIFQEWGERDITLAEAMELAAPIPQWSDSWANIPIMAKLVFAITNSTFCRSSFNFYTRPFFGIWPLLLLLYCMILQIQYKLMYLYCHVQYCSIQTSYHKNENWLALPWKRKSHPP